MFFIRGFLGINCVPCTLELSGQLGLVADPVIEAIAGLEFEDGMRTGVLPGGC